jgi:hypothetical protein
MAALLMHPDGMPETQELLKLYSKQAKHFDQANPQEYIGMESLLEDMWGW